MRKHRKSLASSLFFFISFFFGLVAAFAQEPTTISKPDLVFRNDTLIIKYDFQNCKAKQTYTVWIVARTFDGEIFTTHSLTGDIGDGIVCGTNKVIYWDMAGDSVFIDDVVFVKVLANISETSKLQKGQQPHYFFSSLIFPGGGLTQLKKNKKPYWLMGVAGYGGLSSTLLFGQKAKSDLNSYNQETDPDRRLQLYDSYKKNQKIMHISAISTGVIWLVNLIWTAATPKEMPGNSAFSSRKIQINPTLFPDSYSTGLMLKYNF